MILAIWIIAQGSKLNLLCCWLPHLPKQLVIVLRDEIRRDFYILRVHDWYTVLNIFGNFFQDLKGELADMRGRSLTRLAQSSA